MYFTSGSDRAFEQLMQTRPGADHFDSGEAGAPEDCGTCRFYRPHWKYQFCVYEECPYQPGKRTALDGAVKFQVKGVDDEMAVFRVEKNRGYLLFVYLFGKLGQTYRLAAGADLSEKLLHLADGFSLAFESAAPSFHLFDLAVGVAGAVALRLMVYCKSKNAKKYRRGVEYGSARWSA